MKLGLRSSAISFLAIILLAGCLNDLPTIAPDMEEKLQSVFGLKNMNQSFQLEIENNEKTFQSGSDIRLKIMNTSPHSIYFDIDSHIKLLTIKDAEWEEVKNGITYKGTLVISPQDTPLLDYAKTRVKPDLRDEFQNTDQKELVRILIIGELMDNDVRTGEFVGAYVDVYIGP